MHLLTILAFAFIFWRAEADSRWVIVGEHDHSTPPACARAIAEAVHGARLETIAGAGHLTTVEQPQSVANLLRPFFAHCATDLHQ